MNYSEELPVLIRLIIAHLLTDFVLQPGSWVAERKGKKFRSPKLYLHALVTGVTAYLFSGKWEVFSLPLLIIITHAIIDGWKSYQKSNTIYFLIDQLLHLLVIVFAWITIIGAWDETWLGLVTLINNPKFLIILSGYILIARPLGILIGTATEKWRLDADINKEGLAKAGLWIGLLERFLILTFILIDQYTAVGLLIAAKSILRFSDKENTQKKTEYVLIGTLMSFSVTFVIGLFIRHLI